MAILNTTSRPPIKLGSSDLHHLISTVRASRCELHFYFFGVRLIVRARVEPSQTRTACSGFITRREAFECCKD